MYYYHRTMAVTLLCMFLSGLICFIAIVLAVLELAFSSGWIQPPIEPDPRRWLACHPSTTMAEAQPPPTLAHKLVDHLPRLLLTFAAAAVRKHHYQHEIQQNNPDYSHIYPNLGVQSPLTALTASNVGKHTRRRRKRRVQPST